MHPRSDLTTGITTTSIAWSVAMASLTAAAAVVWEYVLVFSRNAWIVRSDEIVSLFALYMLAFAAGLAAWGLSWTRLPERLKVVSFPTSATVVLVLGSLAFHLESWALLRLGALTPAWWGVNAVLLLAGGALLVGAFTLGGRLGSRFLRGVGAALALTTLVALALSSSGRDGDDSIVERQVPVGDLPNVVFVLIDTLRADHLSSYGYARSTSPHIDALAREGFRFDMSFAQSSWTRPSTASIFTSLYPSQHNANDPVRNQVPSGAETMPEFFKSFGFNTYAFSTNANVSPEFGFGQGVDRFYNTHHDSVVAQSFLYQAYERAAPFVLRLLGIQARKDDGSRDESVVSEIRKAVEAGLEEPFFLYVHFLAPHGSYEAPPPFRSAFRSPSMSPPVTRHPADSNTVFSQVHSLPADEIESMKAAYDGEILYVDSLVRDVLDLLDEKGLRKNSLTVLTSDHGEEFFDHGGWGHGQSLYNELTRVPLIFHWPGRIRPGSDASTIVSGVDVLPTLVDLMGAEPVPQHMGRSVAPILEGRDDPLAASRFVYAEVLARDYVARSYLSGTEKYFEAFDPEHETRELYELGSDPHETRNLFVDGGASDLVTRMRATQQGLGDDFRATEEIEVRDGTLEELKALGYVD